MRAIIVGEILCPKLCLLQFFLKTFSRPLPGIDHFLENETVEWSFWISCETCKVFPLSQRRWQTMKKKCGSNFSSLRRVQEKFTALPLCIRHMAQTSLLTVAQRELLLRNKKRYPETFYFKKIWLRSRQFKSSHEYYNDVGYN